MNYLENDKKKYNLPFGQKRICR